MTDDANSPGARSQESPKRERPDKQPASAPFRTAPLSLPSGTPAKSFRSREVHGSLYLASALVVLLGAWASLYDFHGRAIRVAILEVSGILVAYQVALALVIAFLHRVRREANETRVLLGILGLLLLDAGFVQHFYGWEAGVGLVAAAIGSGGSILVAVLLAAALRLPLSGRLVSMLLGTILFVRFGPMMLVGTVPGTSFAPAAIALGWVLALLPLFAFLPRPVQKEHRLPLELLDRVGFFGCLAIATLHFLNAGRSFALELPLLAFAPLLVVLSPALERLLPDITQHRSARLVVAGLPWLGLSLAATAIAPSILDAPWAHAWPLSPFFLVLIGTIGVQLFRARHNGNESLAHQAAFLAIMGSLGGDLPEILAAARFPNSLQALATVGIAGIAIAVGRRPREGAVLAALAGFVSAGWIAELGYPWLPAFFASLAASQLSIEATTGWVIPRGPRIAIAGALTALPVAAFLRESDSFVGLAVAVVANLSAFLFGWRRRDLLLRTLAPLSVVAGGIGWLLGWSAGGSRWQPGRLLVELGFLLLAIGFLRSMFGDRVRTAWRDWWDGEALSNANPRNGLTRRDRLAGDEAAS